MSKTVLIFTGGGLAPALNPTLFGVISAAKKNGWRVLGGISGWASLLDNGKIIDLTNLDVTAIENIGGTFLRSSRTNIFALPDGVKQLKQKLADNQIDYVVAIGGNDTLGAAYRLFTEEKIQIVGIPKTVDNDLPNTYWTPGFPSAAKYFSSYVDEIKKDAAYALSRIFVVESQGMNAGWLAASGAYGDADVIIPPEKIVSLEKTLQLIAERYQKNGNFATVVIAQEAKFDQSLETINDDQPDQFKTARNSFVCLALKEKIKQFLPDAPVRALYPGNYVETGNPIAVDRDLAVKLGQKAIELLAENNFGQMACLARPDEQTTEIVVASSNLEKVTEHRALPDDYFDWDNLRVTDKFLNYMEPILGKYQKEKDDPYYQLLKKINS